MKVCIVNLFGRDMVSKYGFGQKEYKLIFWNFWQDDIVLLK